jgi:hypothetical protein
MRSDLGNAHQRAPGRTRPRRRRRAMGLPLIGLSLEGPQRLMQPPLPFGSRGFAAGCFAPLLHLAFRLCFALPPPIGCWSGFSAHGLENTARPTTRSGMCRRQSTCRSKRNVQQTIRPAGTAPNMDTTTNMDTITHKVNTYPNLPHRLNIPAAQTFRPGPAPRRLGVSLLFRLLPPSHLSP